MAAGNWTGDVIGVSGPGSEESVLTRDETTSSFSNAPTHLGYRCLFYRAN